MHAIFYYIPFYLIVSAIGMHIANRKVSVTIKRQRWLKFFTYVLITGIVLVGIFTKKFLWIAGVIIIASAYELIKASTFLPKKRVTDYALVFTIFTIIAFGFFLFSAYFNPVTQLFVYFQVFTFDALCQITGQLFGKHALSPKISPAKTVEGLIGGFLFCILSALLGSSWVHLPLYLAAPVGAITALTAFSGDMLASYFKRIVKIKDYSNLLPGQGGFLDRFDSLMMTGAAYWLLLMVNY